jgi:hypothetical protein
MNSPARLHSLKGHHWPTALRCAGQCHPHGSVPRPLAPDPRPLARRGLSLMELLVATTISIMLMAATVTLFGVVGDKVNAGRAMIETGDRLRATRNRLSADLRGATASFLPWEQASSGSGYFEIVKGPAPNNRDANPISTLLGYTQDVLMLTTRSRDVPFTGRFIGTTIESQVAEVVWFMQPTYNAQGQQQFIMDASGTTRIPTFTLYRRQFLVCPVVHVTTSTPPDVTFAQVALSSSATPLKDIYDGCDISGSPSIVSNKFERLTFNSLSDLTYRENRFAHNNSNASASAPYLVRGGGTDNNANSIGLPIPKGKATSANYDSLTPFQPTYLPDGTTNLAGSQRYGEDVALTNVLSFDVKVWDPGAEIQVDSAGHPLVPSDPGYDKKIKTQTQTIVASPPPSPPHFNPPQFGAYVDLNYTSTTYPFGTSKDTDGFLIANIPGRPDSYFAGAYYGSGTNSGLWAGHLTNGFATYDSWSQGYEYYNSTLAPANYNKANNGFDNDLPNGKNGVNDAGERQTSPPYPVPLRGVQIKIRVYEPTSRQVREVTLTETFLPD